MAITAQQIIDLRADIGDTNNTFSDAEIERIWERVSGASNELIQHEAALALMARQLMNNAAKLHDFSVAGDSNRLSQIFEHLKDIYKMYSPSLEIALGVKPVQVAKGLMRGYPHPDRESPNA
jgi:hypothetical protein